MTVSEDTPVYPTRFSGLADLVRLRGARLLIRSGLPPMDRFPLLPRPLRDVLGAQARAFDAALAADSTGPLMHLPFDAARWKQEFLAEWPPGSPAYRSYFERIQRGPNYTLATAAPPARSDFFSNASSRT